MADNFAEHLKEKGLDQEVIDAFERHKITSRDIKRNDWSHEKLIRMGVQAEGDRSTVLDIIAQFNAYKQEYMIEFKTKVFQDPLHGPIELHPLLVRIIDTPQFQRLRDIKQLGGVYNVYPGASHNRFEHSIGVCYLAGMFIENIRHKQPELGIDNREVLCVKIAGLCHDMGHGPFSHLFQDLFMPKMKPKTKWRHEDTSMKLLDHLVVVNKLHDELKKYGLNWDRDFPFICDLIEGKRGVKGSNEKSFLYEIVANDISGIDVDKMDYIARDCHGLGIKLNFDWRRYVLFSRVIKIKQEGKEDYYSICPREKEVISLYGLFENRNYLFRIAYQHKTKRAVEFMIWDALCKANDYLTIPGKDNNPVKLSEATEDMYAFTRLTDSILYQIRCSSSDELAESRALLERVDKRQLYTFVTVSIQKLTPPSSPIGQPIPRMETCRIEGQIAKLACEGGHYDGSEKVLTDNIYLDWVSFNYGKKDRNPVEQVYFYKKHSPNEAVIVKPQQRSCMLPKRFEESECRIYSKSEDEKIITAIRKGFNQYCKNEDFETPVGEKQQDHDEPRDQLHLLSFR